MWSEIGKDLYDIINREKYEALMFKADELFDKYHDSYFSKDKF